MENQQKERQRAYDCFAENVGMNDIASMHLFSPDSLTWMTFNGVDYYWGYALDGLRVKAEQMLIAAVYFNPLTESLWVYVGSVSVRLNKLGSPVEVKQSNPSGLFLPAEECKEKSILVECSLCSGVEKLLHTARLEYRRQNG